MEQRSTSNPRPSFNRGRARSTPPKKVDRRVLFLALGLAAVAAVLIVIYLKSATASNNEQAVVPTLQVVVAARDIAPGQEISESMVELKALPETAVIQNAATSTTQVVGQRLRYPVSKGEQLNNLRLVEPTKVQALSFQIPRGKRAFTIQVNVNNTPAALIAPGDFVDVLVNGPVELLRRTPQLGSLAGVRGLEDASKATVTLLQNVQVLAVQRNYVENGVPYDSSVRGTPPQKDNVSYITLALTPEEGQSLWQVANEGKITLALRSFGDEDTQTLEPVIPTVKVAVALRDIPAGLEITEEMVRLKEVPESEVIENAATSVDQVAEQTLRYPVVKGEQLTNLLQAELARESALSFQIPHGMRAFTIPVGVNNTPAALVTPGDYVDVLVALDIVALGLEAPEELDEEFQAAMTLLQNVRVLAVQTEYVKTDAPYGPSTRGPITEEKQVSHMTLALSPEEAQLLWLAVAKDAKMTVTLRPYEDSENRPLAPITEPIRTLP